MADANVNTHQVPERLGARIMTWYENLGAEDRSIIDDALVRKFPDLKPVIRKSESKEARQ